MDAQYHRTGTTAKPDTKSDSDAITEPDTGADRKSDTSAHTSTDSTLRIS